MNINKFFAETHMRKMLPYISAVLMGVLLCFSLALFGIFSFTQNGVQNYYVGAVDNNSREFVWKAQSTPEQIKEVLAWIKEDAATWEILQKGTESEQNLALMAWLMNQVSSARVANEDVTPYQMLLNVRNGEGAACVAMSTMLAELVTIKGRKARVIRMLSGVHSRYDAHVVTEVWENGRWVLYDPTFNLTFANDKGELFDSLQVRERLRTNGDVSFVFHGEVNYPARIESYYIDYAQLVEYIYPSTFNTLSIIEKIPPFRYFLKPPITIFFSEESEISRGMDAFRLHNKLYALFFCYLPMAGIGFSLVFILLLIVGIRKYQHI